MLYLSEADPYASARMVVHPALAALPDEDLAEALRLHGIDAEALNDFVGQIGQRMPSITQGALQGASMGAAAGPYGALFGALGGAVAGGLTAPQPHASAPPPAPATAPAPPAGTAPAAATAVPTQPAPPAPAAGGSPAAAQLLALLSQPQVMQALLAMSLGSAGARSVDVGGTNVPVGTVPRALSTLANQAAAEYEETFGDDGTAPEPDVPVAQPQRARRLRVVRADPEVVWVEAATYEPVYG